MRGRRAAWSRCMEKKALGQLTRQFNSCTGKDTRPVGNAATPSGYSAAKQVFSRDIPVGVLSPDPTCVGHPSPRGLCQ